MSTLKNKTDVGGMLGERVTVRKVNGNVVVTNRPKRKNNKLTEKLLAQRKRFQAASHYAKDQTKHEESRALYSAGIKGKHESIYSVALGDFLNAPEVKSIDTVRYHGAIGDIIVIDAVDDFMVAEVEVIITSAAGKLIEKGEAKQNPKRVNQWKYKTVAANPTLAGTKILAIAYDHPENSGTAEVVLAPQSATSVTKNKINL